MEKVFSAVTVRQKIILLLEEGTVGFRELAKQLRISNRDLADHLSHISRTMKSKGKRLTAYPFRCMDCGFLFRDRKHFGKPGHCPLCRSTHIDDPPYAIGR